MGLGIWVQVQVFVSFYFITGHGPPFLHQACTGPSTMKGQEMALSAKQRGNSETALL